MSVQQARRALDASGFRVIVVAPQGSGLETTHVVSAGVPESSRMEGHDRDVVLLVGTMEGTALEVPDVSGLDLGEAQEMLRAWGMRLGAVTTRPDSTEQSGTVLSQNPAASVKVDRNTSVDLVLSTEKP
jgi:beta-lactam-binding protein with PASTA domain